MIGITYASNHTVKIGVLAKRGHKLTLNRWNETALYLNREIPGSKFEIVPIPFKEIFKEVAKGDIDFILTNSGFYVELEHDYGVQRIVTLINKHVSGLAQKEFGGVIFSRIEDAQRFKTLKDIEGAKFAAVNSRSFGGWQMAWRELIEHGIDKDDLGALHFTQTHDKVVYEVLSKGAEVGTVRTDTLERMALENKIDLADIHIINQKMHKDFPYLVSTKLYPEWPLSKLQHTPDRLANDVAVALMNMKSNEKAAIKGKVVGWTTPLRYQPVHDCFKILQIPPYFQEIKFWDALAKYWAWILFFVAWAIGGVTMYLRQLHLTRNLQKTQSELVQTEKMASLGRLVAGISHEINTPIGIGVTAASYLRKETQNFEKAYKDESLTQSVFEEFIDHSLQSSEMILTNLERAANLIQSFKQISVDQSSDEIRVFYLDEYLQSIVTSLHPRLKTTKHNVDIICSKSLQIESNPGVFYQIISNLIINSIIHGFEEKEEGHMVISVRPIGSNLEVIYEDDGKGMSKTNLDKIFDPFFTTKRSAGGSGLGTHIVFNLVTQKLNGTITAESKEGEGLRFIMIFKDIKYV